MSECGSHPGRPHVLVPEGVGLLHVDTVRGIGVGIADAVILLPDSVVFHVDAAGHWIGRRSPELDAVGGVQLPRRGAGWHLPSEVDAVHMQPRHADEIDKRSDDRALARSGFEPHAACRKLIPFPVGTGGEFCRLDHAAKLRSVVGNAIPITDDFHQIGCGVAPGPGTHPVVNAVNRGLGVDREAGLTREARPSLVRGRGKLRQDKLLEIVMAVCARGCHEDRA